MYRFLTALLLTLPLTLGAQAGAQVYKSVDENGNTVYSDKPPANGSKIEEIQLGTTNSTPPPPPIARPKAPVEAKKIEVEVEIVSPASDTTIAIGYMGNFTVGAQVSPPLTNGASAQLLMNGSPMGEPQSHTSWSLSNVFRGEYVLTVVVTDVQGEKLAVSPPVTVYVLRASVN